MTACTSGPPVSTDRHSFTGTVLSEGGHLTLSMQSPEGLSCRGTALPEAEDMNIVCDNGLNAELIGVRDSGYFDAPVPFRFNNGAIGTATLQKS